MTRMPSSPKALLDAHGLRSKKHFGQNFMTDQGLCRRIAERASSAGGTFVEIGAGLGALTRALAERADHVIAIERDRDLVPLLGEVVRETVDAENVEILEADAKQVDWAALLEGRPRPHVVCGNLPYHLTGPLLEKTVQTARSIDRAVYLVQLEVAQRLCAHPNTAAYGALTVFTQAACSVERAFVVKRGAFYPQPVVDSAVVVLIPHATPKAVEDDAFRAVVRAAFGQRRKTLRNAWRGLVGLSDEAVRGAADRAGIDLAHRGESLNVDAFARMSHEVSK